MTAEPRKTPLYEAHRRAGAKIIDFGGWWMPVNYPSGIIAEHRATRQAVGVFDVSHMGEAHFRGARAAEAVQRLITNDLGKLADGHALYTVACRENGGIVDDFIVYRIAADHFLIVVNASNREKDLGWFRDNVGGWCEIADASDATALIAFQGPLAQAALQPLTALPLSSVRSFDLVSEGEIAGVPASIARTGYTAEDGFEIFCDAARAEALWQALVDAAGAVGGKPVGLGARDTLRLEGRLSLYGNDLSEETTPLEAGLGWVVKLDGPADFIGKAALREQKARGVRRKLVGFVMRGRGVARHGYPIHAAGDGAATPASAIGTVTSGTYGPTVDKNIGLGYVPSELASPGQTLLIDCRGKLVEAEVVNGPFYKRASEQTR
ncbi:MAG TPA: glycine cleavage system aminomethyltransferase GcvT [Polyangia bacterium]|jgi:aminomethyltransferase|nr:glycine cleavage system aminomethyltransferase GcvT [Polyangia bacterium]